MTVLCLKKSVTHSFGDKKVLFSLQTPKEYYDAYGKKKADTMRQAVTYLVLSKRIENISQIMFRYC